MAALERDFNEYLSQELPLGVSIAPLRTPWLPLEALTDHLKRFGHSHGQADIIQRSSEI